MKRALWIVFIIYWSIPSIAQAVIVKAPTVSGYAGESIVVPIEINDASGVLAVEFTLNYNSTILTATGASTTQFTSGYTFVDKITDGSIRVVMAGTIPLNGTGDVANINFDILPDANPDDSSLLTLTQVRLNGGKISVSVSNGSLTVVPKNVAVIIPPATGTAGDEIVVPIQVADASDITNAFFRVSYNLAVLTALSASVTDLTSDFTLSQQIGTGAIEITMTTANATTGNGAFVNITFRVAEDAPGGSTSPLTFSQVTLNQDRISAIVTNGVFTTQPSARLTVPSLMALPGENFTLPIEIDDATGVFAVKLVLTYNANLLTATQARTSALTDDFISIYKLGQGQITLVMAGTAALSGGGTIANVNFNVSSNASAGTSSDLSLTEAQLNAGLIVAKHTDGTFSVPSATDVTVSIPNVSGAAGSEITVPIHITEDSTLFSADFTLTYDAELLTATAVEKTDLTSEFLINFKPSTGEVNISMAGTESISDSGDLAAITFQVADQAQHGQSCNLTLTSFQLNAGATTPIVIVQNGTFTVDGTVWGDVSGDGNVTAHDADLIFQYVIGLISLSQEQQKAADVSNDDRITAYDAALILQYIVGLIAKFPIETR